MVRATGRRWPDDLPHPLTGINRRMASYVGRIVNGVKPDRLPLQRPTQFALVINPKTAKVPGFTIPQSMLLRADEVI